MRLSHLDPLDYDARTLDKFQGIPERLRGTGANREQTSEIVMATTNSLAVVLFLQHLTR